MLAQRPTPFLAPERNLGGKVGDGIDESYDLSYQPPYVRMSRTWPRVADMNRASIVRRDDGL